MTQCNEGALCCLHSAFRNIILQCEKPFPSSNCDFAPSSRLRSTEGLFCFSIRRLIKGSWALGLFTAVWGSRETQLQCLRSPWRRTLYKVTLKTKHLTVPFHSYPQAGRWILHLVQWMCVCVCVCVCVGVCLCVCVDYCKKPTRTRSKWPYNPHTETLLIMQCIITDTITSKYREIKWKIKNRPACVSRTHFPGL